MFDQHKIVKKNHKRPQDEPVFSGVRCANKVHTHQTELIQDYIICAFRLHLAIWLCIYADHEAFRLGCDAHSFNEFVDIFFTSYSIYIAGLQ